MSRLKRSPKISTRESRRKLAVRHEPYWQQIHSGISIGYRKGKRGGSWIRRQAVAGGYQKETLGIADDHVDADAKSILSYAQAFGLAVAGVNAEKPQLAKELTVSDVLDDYLEWHEANSQNARTTQYVIDADIRKALGDKLIDDLTTTAIRRWHQNLAKGKKSAATDAESVRKRKATANRVLTVLKAALQHAWSEDRIERSDSWRRVRPFRGVDAPTVRFLTEAECRRLIKNCVDEFRPVVRAALMTGCRYGEITRFVVEDYDFESKSIVVRQSKSGKARHVPLTDEGVVFFDSQTAGRSGSETIFLRTAGLPWGKSQQTRPMRAACEGASIDPPVSFHILRHTYGSLLARKGVSLQVIAAAMGHADTRMTERHYAHLQPGFVAEQIRKHLPTIEKSIRKMKRI